MLLPHISFFKKQKEVWIKFTQKYIQKENILKGRTEYMFWAIVKKNSGYRFRDINKPITYSSVREDVFSVLRKLGLSSKEYSLHNMLADGCTMATDLGVREKWI